MRSILAGLRTLVLPWGAGPNAPALVLGRDMPPELVAFFSPITISGAAIWRINATTYRYQLSVVGPFGPTTPLVATGWVVAGTVTVQRWEFPDPNGNPALNFLLWPNRRSEFQSDLHIETGIKTPLTDFTIGERNLFVASQPRGFRGLGFATTSSAAVGPAETVVLSTSAAVFFFPGRAYRISWGRAMAGSTNGAALLVRARQTNLAGQDLGIMSRIINNAPGLPFFMTGVGYVVRTASTVLTAVVALTMTAGAGTVTHVGSATEPRFVLVEDCGSAADYPLGVAIV